MEQTASSDDNVVRIGNEIAEVFAYWRTRFGHARARLDAKRRQKIRLRLCDGYSVRDLLDAIEGCSQSKFHMGSNQNSKVYNDIELICRDASHVDMFIQANDRFKADRARALALSKQTREEEERLERERRARVVRIDGWRKPT